MDGDGFVAPDVSVIKTPGHTPGHQSVVVRLADGRCHISSGDAIPLMENLERKIVLGNAYDAKKGFESLYRLENLSKLLNAQIIPSHDIAVFETMNKIPEAL